ncbi:MAG: cobalamin-dependent protein [Deltaproteobacteria bacterium]|nr:cobalamin-dependent protein [Deltaproteobacteria bacterium]
MDYLNVLKKAVLDGDDIAVLQKVQDALSSGLSASDILNKGLVPGIRALGQVYLPEILISTQAMNRGVEELKPHLTDADVSKKGAVVLGTVKGDLHDIGKNFVGLMLGSNGFNVVDLGVDVSADAFISAVRDHNADIIALSGLLTTTTTYFPVVIRALEERIRQGSDPGREYRQKSAY